jgi:hypothetical protein
MTYTEKAASLVPNSAARWRAIQNILANNNQRNTNRRTTPRNTQIIYVQEKNTPTQIYAKSVKSIKIQRQFNEAA